MNTSDDEGAMTSNIQLMDKKDLPTISLTPKKPMAVEARRLWGIMDGRGGGDHGLAAISNNGGRGH